MFVSIDARSIRDHVLLRLRLVARARARVHQIEFVGVDEKAVDLETRVLLLIGVEATVGHEELRDLRLVLLVVVGVVADAGALRMGRPFPVEEVVRDQVELGAARLAADDVEEEVKREIAHLEYDEAFDDGHAREVIAEQHTDHHIDVARCHAYLYTEDVIIFFNYHIQRLK